MVRKVESDNAVLIFDDTIQERQYTDESELIYWYFDLCTGRGVKGINLLNTLYHSNNTSTPVVF